jgi:hypothetical protein
MASDDGNNARSSGVRQWPDEAARSSADMLMVSASIVALTDTRHCRWRLTTLTLIVSGESEIKSFARQFQNKLESLVFF